MTLKKTGYTDKTAERLLIDAAVLYTNVTYTKEGGFVGDLHGATSGGVSLEIEQEYKVIEVDGTSHTRVKGLRRIESAVAMATTNVKEITANSIKSALNGVVRDATADEAPTGYKIVESKRFVNDSDYLENVAIVGRLSGTSEPVIVILDNALSTTGLAFETEDNEEAVMEQTFEAHASVEQLEKNELPWRILYPPVEGSGVAAMSIEAPEGPTKTGDDK